MIALLQRVSEARVEVNGRTVGAIGPGLLVLVGVEKNDQQQQAQRMVERLLAYRVFPDDQERMNLDLRQADGELLLVSQFTLAANTNKGNRPGFSAAADSEAGRELFERVVELARQELGEVQTGEYGAHMRVHLVNDGPVTIRLRVPPGLDSE